MSHSFWVCGTIIPTLKVLPPTYSPMEHTLRALKQVWHSGPESSCKI